jgi:hypothetical protein
MVGRFIRCTHRGLLPGCPVQGPLFPPFVSMRNPS